MGRRLLGAALALLCAGCMPGGPGAPAAPVVKGLVNLSRGRASWTFAASHGDNLYPPDLVRPATAPCSTAPLAADWVRRENALPGDPGWRPTPPASGVELFLRNPSVTCGDTLDIRLGGAGSPGVQVAVDRLGWYGGAGARRVWTSPLLAVAPDPEVHQRAHVSPTEPWRQQVTVPVGAQWNPGLYVAEALQGHDRVAAAAFVVRRAEPRPAPLVVVDSNLTWAAYGIAGGASLYVGPHVRHQTHAQAVAHRSYSVSMLRPTEGTGLYQLLYTDVPLAQLLDRLGLPADHVLDTDLEIRPSVLLHHNGIVIPGHSEYWTTRAYDAVRIERNRGVNIADMGANTIYWHARLTHDAAGAPAMMTVFRQAKLDPLAALQPADATVKWDVYPLSRASSTVLGEPMGTVGARNGGYVLHDPPAWLVAGTPATNGTVLAGAVENEADGARADSMEPPNVQVVAEGVLRGPFGDRLVSATYYSDPSGAGVFDAGVTWWLCEAMGECAWPTVSPRTATLLGDLAANVLRDFSTPRWGRLHPSHLFVPASGHALLAHLPPAAVGAYGPENEGNEVPGKKVPTPAPATATPTPGR